MCLLKMAKLTIVGSGIAGIAASIRLALKGHKVKVFESNQYPGGKIAPIESKGFRFNYGPQLLTLPQQIDELFKISGKDPKDYFDYKRKDVHCVYFWDNKKKFIAYDDKDKYYQNFEKTFDINREIIKKYFEKSKNKYDLTHKIFLENSLHKLRTYLKRDTIKAIAKISSLNIGKSLHALNKQYFKNELVVQMFDRYATYNGSNPYQTPGIMSLIQHLENHYGTYLPTEGMDSISQSLYSLACENGVKFYFNETVERIFTKDGKVKGIATDKREIESDIIISNMDIYHTYKKLLPSYKIPKKVKNNERSSSALVFYWGIKKSFPELDLHNIFFSSDYKKEFDKIFKENDISNDPTIYVNISSKDIPGHAPINKENWYVMINVPWNENQDWVQKTEKLKRLVIKKIDLTLSTNIEKLIETEKIVTPLDISNDTLSYKGALYGSSSNSKLSAFLRHPNFSKKIKNLYFVGGSVHPGGGIPLCLLSAKIVDNLISQ